jgi:hypothetical protein
MRSCVAFGWLLPVLGSVVACSSGANDATGGGGSSTSDGGVTTAATSGSTGSHGGGGGVTSSTTTGEGGGASTSCTIGGSSIAAGTVDPSDPCQVCNPTANATDWSTAPNGLACGPESQCQTGVCHVVPPSICDIHVPGDYAGIQEAVTALRGANLPAIVCIADGTYTGDINLDYGTAELTLVGSTASKVTIAGKVTDGLYVGQPALVRIRGVTITGGVVSAKSISLEASVVRAPAGTHAIQLMQWPSVGTTNITIDGCDISAPSAEAIRIARASAQCPSVTPLSVTIRNSYIHDSMSGLAVYFSSCPDGAISAFHNTLSNNGTGILLTGQALYQYPDTELANNLIVGSTAVGITSTRPSGNTADNLHHNALFGNVTNYSGVAAPGVGYVTTDPLVTNESPPRPKTGSPLIGAGDAAVVSANDYYGVSRNGRADIGAVEGP